MFVQSERYFVIVDNIAAVQVYTYDGRLVSTPKFAGLRADLLSRATISFAGECVLKFYFFYDIVCTVVTLVLTDLTCSPPLFISCVAILQRKSVDTDSKAASKRSSGGDGDDVADSVIRASLLSPTRPRRACIQASFSTPDLTLRLPPSPPTAAGMFDVTTGRERGSPVRHSVKILSLALSQYAGQPLRPVGDDSGRRVSFSYRYIVCESCSQFDSLLPLAYSTPTAAAAARPGATASSPSSTATTTSGLRPRPTTGS